MEALQGYYDGTAIRPLGKVKAKPNQKVVITIMDEFIVPEKVEKKKSMRGAIAKYASAARREKEEGARAQARMSSCARKTRPTSHTSSTEKNSKTAGRKSSAF